MDKLKRTRGGYRSAMTKLLQKLDAAIVKQEQITLEELHEQLVEREGKLKDVNQSILEELIANDATEEEIAEEIDVSDEWMRSVVRERKRAEKTMDILLKGAAQVVTALPTPTTTAGSKPASQVVKLPRLEIKKFTGDFKDWERFWGQFQASIHDNSNIADIQKFSYLQSLIEGLASDAISGLALTTGNYATAINTLKERFGQKELIVHAHMTHLLQLEALGKNFDIWQLRKLYDDCLKQTQSLEALGVAVDNYGALLSPVILKLLPESILHEWNRQSKTAFFKFKDLMDFLKTEVEGRERTALILDAAKPVKTSPRFDTSGMKRDSNLVKPSASALLTEVKQPSEEQPDSVAGHSRQISEEPARVKLCAFCASSLHPPWECTVPGGYDSIVSVARKNGLCFQCLREFHLARKCTRSRCPNCNGKHHKFLCRKSQGEKETYNEHFNVDAQGVVLLHNVLNMPVAGKAPALMKRAHAWVEGEKTRLQVQCILDDGSQRSFIRQELVTALGLNVLHDELLSVQGFGGCPRASRQFSVVRVKLRDPHKQKYICELELLVVPEIATFPLSKETVGFDQFLKNRSLTPAIRRDWNFASDKIDILIGLDFYWMVLTGGNQIVYEGLVASESRLGWIINGSLCNSQSETPVDVKVMLTVVPATDQWISNCWNLDALGVPNSEMKEQFSEEDMQVQQRFEETAQYLSGRYRVSLPWNRNSEELASNSEVAQQRLMKQITAFKKDPKYYLKYQQAMQEYITNKHVEEAPQKFDAKKLYYLPHHAVMREDRLTTKVRIVFDASSKAKDALSLNECLSVGPNLNPNLVGMLLRFRLHPIAFISDIEKAFLQVELHPNDRDATRFFWVEDNWEPGNEVTLKQYRMTRVLFGAKPSPYLLAATIRHHLKIWPNVSEEVRQDLDRNVYMDDYLSGESSVMAAHDLAEESRKVLKEAGMLLKKWVTNSAELHEIWLAEDADGEMKIQSPENIQKVLGVMWHPKEDWLALQVKSLESVLEEKIITKRTLLQASARIFDPLGFVCPIVIKIRSLFQTVWKLKMKWNTVLQGDLKLQWEKIKWDLRGIKEITVPRWVDFGEESCAKQIHIFCDASQTAFGAVSYVRVSLPDGIHVSLLAAKGRLAPLKSVTMPRLELLGCLIGAKLGDFIWTSLQCKIETYFWTDSTIVLHWIKGSSRKLDTFVANRTDTIKELTDGADWRYCPTNDNPADLISRGEFLEKLKISPLWWNGPLWLSSSEDSWPATKFACQREEEGALLQIAETKRICKEALLDLSKFSTLWKATRIVAWVLRFLDRIRRKPNMQEQELQVPELEEALKYWIRRIQYESFPEEFGGPGKRSDKLKQLNPFMDEEGILRISGRLKHSSYLQSVTHPILLPGDHRFTRLLITQHHERLLHAGLPDILTDLRERYWILRARQVVKQEIRKCFACKRLRVKPVQVLEGQLPKERITPAPPFQVSGVDYAGPVYVRAEGGTRKAYILLFTCAVTRAVHLEAVSSLSAEDFMLGFRRFVSRRGLCLTLYSDNARTFQCADKHLQKLWKDLKKAPSIQEYFGKHGISWKYIVERAAWWGGFWERMVKSVKGCLKRVLGQACLRFEELSTVLAEVEAVLNSRPLTVIYDDTQDPSPLTPAHFLIGKRVASLPIGGRSYQSGTGTGLNKRWIYCQRLTNEIWKRWHSEYLCQLRSAHQQHGVANKSPDIRVGDLVLVAEPKTPRHLWPCGVILELCQGRDKLIRSCYVKMKGSGTVLRRPVQLLCPLEIGLERDLGAGNVANNEGADDKVIENNG